MQPVCTKYNKPILLGLFFVLVISTSTLSQSVNEFIFNQKTFTGETTNLGLAKAFYKYQDIEKFNQFTQSYIAGCIHCNLEREVLFETQLFLPLQQYGVETYKFDPIFRMPQYPDIQYLPGKYWQRRIDEYTQLMQSNRHYNTYAEAFEERYPIADVKQAFVFSHPEHIKLSWDSIPEPPVIGRRGFLKRRSASEGISLLLRSNTYDTHPSLEKIKVLKGPWSIGGTENIQFAQGYIDNWVKGGESSITLSSDLRLNADYKKGKHEWENYIIHKVGIISTENDKGRVNTDLIEINTKYGHKASAKWYYSFLYNFKTQLFYGYAHADKDKEAPVSGFMAPAYMSFAIGMDYKPSRKFTLLLSPITSRITIVNDTVKFNQTKFGVPENKSSHVVNGISVVNNFEYLISKEIKLSSRFDAFYQYLDRIKDEDGPQVQLDWEVILDMRINRFLSTRLLAHARYFTNESEKLQFREDFNIAFRYHF